MQALEAYLEQLHSLESNRYYDPLDVIQDLKQVCFNDIPEDQLGICSSLLFGKESEHNLIKFLDKTLTTQTATGIWAAKITKAREHILQFISELIDFLGTRIQDHALEIKDICIGVFRKDTSNTARSLTFPPIAKLIKLGTQQLDADALNVKALAEMYLQEYAVGASKLSQTLKSDILELLGLLCEIFPERMFDKSNTLLQLYLSTIQKEFTADEPKMQIIAGSLTGLTSLLIHFSGDFLAVQKNIQDLYKSLLLGLSIPEKLTRYAVPIASLKLLASHAFLFKEYLTEDAERMFGLLSKLCKHHNKDVHRKGFEALDAFLQQVANELVAEARDINSNRATYKFFVRKFFEMLENPAGGVEEISIAVRGFGRFAAPTAKYSSIPELKKVLNKLFQFSERYYAKDEATYHMSSFLSSYANILLHLDQVDSLYIDHLARVIGSIFAYFPTLWPKQRIAHYFAISRLFTALYSKQSALQTLLSRVVFQGIAFTCSRQTAQPPPQAAPAAAAGAGSPDNAAAMQEERYEQYRDLWRHILDPITLPDLEMTDADRLDMKRIIYEQFITSTLTIIQKLDLSYDAAHQTATAANSTTAAAAAAANADDDAASELTSDIFRNLQPNMPKDFELFLNLVSFSRDILLSVHTKLFLPWLYLFGRTVIEQSNRYPLVSGFYKLASIALVLSEKHGYFENIFSGLFSQSFLLEDDSRRIVIEDEEAGDDAAAAAAALQPAKSAAMTPAADLETRQVCFTLFSKFIKEVLVRVQQYKEELLASCIQLVLSVPKQFVEIATLVPALQTALKMVIGLDALEYWSRVMPAAVMPHLPQILPYLSDYLSIDSSQYERKIALEQDDDTLAALSGGNSKSTAVQYKTRTKKKASKTLGKSEAAELQFRILRLLGKLGGANHAVVGDVDLTSGNIAWDVVERLRFSFPFQDMKPEVFMVVVELAETARERQTKVAACELLHSLVLYMVGSSASIRSREMQFYRIYQHVFPSLIRLACDVELVARQLFEPLVFQLIHWFTKNAQYENEETMNLLDAIVDAVGNHSNGGLRDFAAKCLSEFLKWSLKHSTQQQQEKNPINVKSLFKRLYSLAHHPDPYKRLGCALTFNQVYRVFREEEVIVDQFIFEMMLNIMFSLRLCHHDDPSMGTADSVALVIKNLTRIVVKYRERLARDNKNRRGKRSLAEFVEWVFQETRRVEDRCRAEAMELFIKLAPLVPGTKSAAAWVQRQTKDNNASWLLSIYEPENYLALPSTTLSDDQDDDNDISISSTSSSSTKGRKATKTTTDASSSTSSKITAIGTSPKAFSFIEDLITFYARLRSLTDSYRWTLKEEFVSPEMLTFGVCNTNLFTALTFFISDCIPLTMNESLSSEAMVIPIDQRVATTFASLTPLEMDRYQLHKCLVITHMFELLILLLDKFPTFALSLPSELFAQPLFALIFQVVLQPEIMGFSSSETRQGLTHASLLSTASQLLRLLVQRLPHTDGGLPRLHSTLQSILASEASNLFHIDLTDAGLNLPRSLALVEGYKRLHEIELLLPNLPPEAANLATDMAQGVFDTHHRFTPTQLLLASSVLELCFATGLAPHTLIGYLLDESASARTSATTAAAASGGDGADGADLELELELELEEESISVRQPAASGIVPANLSVTQATRGSVFYGDFAQPIVAHVLGNFGDYCAHIMSNVHQSSVMFRLLLDCIDTQARRRESPSSAAATLHHQFLDELSAHVSKLSSWYAIESSSRDKENMLEFLKRMLRVDPVHLLASRERSAWVREVLTSLLARTIPLTLKNEVLELLAPVIQHMPAAFTAIRQSIKEALVNVTVYDFPAKSTDLPRGSTVLAEYLGAIDKLLYSLVTSGSLEVLEVLFGVLREEDHVHRQQIDLALQRFVGNLSDEQARNTFWACWAVFMDKQHQDSLKLAVVRKIAAPVCHHMSMLFATTVFSECIGPLMSLISDELDFSSGKTSSNEELSALLNTHTCAYHLLNTLYECLPAKTIRDVINLKYCEYLRKTDDIKGNELTTAIMRLAHGAKPKQLNRLGLDEKLVRDFQCTAYNTLASVVICTQTKEQFFTVFFFKENPKKNELIWSNIVDLRTEYHFEVETPKFPAAKEAIEGLRKSENATDQQQAADATAAAAAAAVRYVSSQYLANTSLSQDLNNMGAFFRTQQTELSMADDTSSTASTSTEIVIPTHVAGALPRDPAAAALETRDNDTIELDPINSNPCMIAILRLIDRMKTLFAKEYTPDVMPKWMAELHAVMTSNDTHPNIVLFITKIILNKPSVFQPYYASWLAPLLELCLSPAIGKGVNYYFRDVLLLLLQWPQAKPTDAHQELLASRLMDLLIRYAYYPSNEIVKTNIDIFKLFVERWKGSFHVSKKLILDLMSVDINKSTSKLCRATGLQLLGVLVANGYPLYDEQHDGNISFSKLADALLSNLDHSHKEIYCAASEVCGVIVAQHLLKARQGESVSHAKNFLQLLHDKITSHFARVEIDRALQCLDKISIHCPPFLDKFYVRIFSSLPNLIGEFKVIALNLIVVRIEHLGNDNVWTQLRPSLKKLIAHREADAQLAILRILFVLVKTISTDDIMALLEILTSANFPEHHSQECRDMFLNVLIQVYDQHEHLRDAVRPLLLTGLSDKHQPIQEKMLQFWNSDERLSSQTIVRLQQILSIMYDPAIEDAWLSFATQLLLLLTYRSPDFDIALFQPLTDSKFYEYSIDFSVQRRSLPMSPMFSSQSQDVFSQASSSMDVEDQMRQGSSGSSAGGASAPSSFPGMLSGGAVFTPHAPVSFVGGGDVRATTSARLFTPTMDSSSSAAPGHAEATSTSSGAGAGAATADPNAMELTLTGSLAPTSLDVFAKPSIADYRRRRTGTLNLASSQEVRVPKRFFRHENPNIHPHLQKSHVHAAWVRQQRVAAREKRIRELRANEIVMYRRYRTGELPDVQIKPRELIQPLQALASREPTVARMLFVQLFKAVLYSELPATSGGGGAGERRSQTQSLSSSLTASLSTTSSMAIDPTGGEVATLTAAVRQLIETLLSKSTRHSSPFIGCLLRTCHDAPVDLISTMNPALAASSALSSNNLHTGVVLLEKQILSSAIEQHPAAGGKRGRGARAASNITIDADQSAWMQLAKLYKALGDEDVLMGLYSKHLCQSQFSREALQFELKGDYASALQTYERALKALEEREANAAEQGTARGARASSSSSTSSRTQSSTSSASELDDVSDLEIGLWYSGRLECFNRLSYWDELAANTLVEVHNTEQLWEREYREPYLGYFLRSHIKTRAKWPALYEFLDNTKDPQHREYLEAHFLGDLTLLAICRDDLDRARYYITRYYHQFLRRWANLHPLATVGKHNTLQGLQRMVEMEEVLQLFRHEHSISSLVPLQRLLSRWSHRYPSVSESDITVWDDVITTRAILLEKINSRFTSFWKARGAGTETPAGTAAAAAMSITGDTLLDADDADAGAAAGGAAGGVNLKALKRMLMQQRGEFYREMATGARKQGNFLVADKYLKLCIKSFGGVSSGSSFSFPFFHSLVKLYCEKAKQQGSFDMFQKALEYMDKRKQEPGIVNVPMHRQKFYVLRADIFNELAQLALSNPELAKSANTSVLSLKGNTSVPTQLFHKAYSCYDRASAIHRERHEQLQQLQHGAATGTSSSFMSAASSSSSSAASSSAGTIPASSYSVLSYPSLGSSGVVGSSATAAGKIDTVSAARAAQQAGKSFYKFAAFCDSQLKRLEQSSERGLEGLATSKSALRYAETITANMLAAMALQSSSARDRFPRVLKLISVFPSIQALFQEKVDAVPTWMFIRWISQMMGLLDKAGAEQVIKILTRIASHYPQALYYPFKISSECLDPDTQRKVAPLAQLLAHPILDTFIDELQQLTHPEHRFKDWLESVKPLLSAAPSRTANPNTAAIQALYEELRRDVLDVHRHMIGTYNRKFASDWATPISSAFGKDGAKLAAMDLKTFAATTAKLLEKMTKGLGSATVKAKLSEFSGWLDQFDSSNLSADTHIEIPGQYDGLSKPQPLQHIKISSFDSDLLVMGSLRKPKRLKIRGNDEIDHSFLVKGGEDLRLDQRVQQLFSVMNEILRNDPACQKRNLSITTYQVVPMTSKVGMLEWLQNTKPIKAIIEEEIAKKSSHSGNHSILSIEAAKIHEQWLTTHSSRAARLCDKYSNMYRNASRADTINKVDKQHTTVDWDLLRSAVMCLAASPEAYLSIRSHFARSLATFNIASYIIGIGDRHLDNFLLSSEDGGLIGIDFGHAFGTATQFLPVPELVPFRLTRQFTNFLKPLDTEGLLNHNMIHTMRALQQSKDVLLNTMDIFITEPLVDWEKLARRLQVIQEGEGNASSWFPEQKLRIVTRKLERDNPADILIDELRTSVHGRSPALKHLENIVTGVEGINVRTQFRGTCPSTAEQVACLVDLATDPNILGRMYAGWAAWI